MHNREMVQLLPKTGWGLECLNPYSIQVLFVFSKNKWAAAGFQRLLISLQNGTATFIESDSQLFRVDNNLYAGRQAHQVICIRQRIRFVEIIDTPGQPTLRVAPGSKTADMEISYCQYHKCPVKYFAETEKCLPCN